jgi:hypothetical protein
MTKKKRTRINKKLIFGTIEQIKNPNMNPMMSKNKPNEFKN